MTSKSFSRLLLLFVLFAVIFGLVPLCAATSTGANSSSSERVTYKKKVLFINSYDLDFSWSLSLFQGALTVLDIGIDEDLNIDDSKSPIEFRLFNMKTKKNRSIEQIKASALAAKQIIEEWKPDVVICADDNASKYLIVPYYKNTSIPFVFCGVNWSAKEYGFPCNNVTGMIEVFPIQAALDTVRPLAQGDRIGFLSNDTLSEHKNAEYIEKLFNVELVTRFVGDFDSFERDFKKLQTKSDILMIIENETIKGFSMQRFRNLTQKYTKIPTFSFAFQGHENYLIIFRRLASEQGEWAAKAALQILEGKSPADIPIAMNNKAGIRLNMKMAKKIGVKFPMELIEVATFVGEETVK